MAANPQPQSRTIPTVKLLIDGRFVESKAREWRDVVNPATQEVLARVPMCGPDEIDRAVKSAAQAFKAWRSTPIAARARIMLKLQELVRRDMKKIAAVLTDEQGKTLPDAEGDVFRGLEVVEHACSIGTLTLGEFAENVAGNVDTYFIRQPLGVCAMITPWNFPMAIPSWKLLPALVCGNTCVIKPAQDTPLSTFNLVRTLVDAGVPKGVLNIVTGFGSKVGGPLTEHPDIRAVSLTGSTEVGRIVGTSAAKSFKHCSLELGGKNPMIVLDDANLDLAIDGG
ncbi:MAG TPA: aldehyde dehydrogenase family protein, partial [Usitatibacter sp.]